MGTMFQIPEGTFGTSPWIRASLVASILPCVSNPRRNVWNPGREREHGDAHTQFQIPEGTFGTPKRARGPRHPVGVSNPRRNVWNDRRTVSNLLDRITFQIPEGTFGTTMRQAADGAQARGFKSQKERLELVG